MVGGIVFGSIGVAATTYFSASQISYTPSDSTWKVSDVRGALDDLYQNVNTSSVQPMEVKTNGTYDYSVRYTRTYQNIGWKKVTYTEGANIQYVAIGGGSSLSASDRISVGTSVDVSQYDSFTIYVQGIDFANSGVYANFLFE